MLRLCCAFHGPVCPLAVVTAAATQLRACACAAAAAHMARRSLFIVCWVRRLFPALGNGAKPPASHRRRSECVTAAAATTPRI